MTTEEIIDDLFNQLDEWKQLPGYQLERRADIFFAIHLKEILEDNIKTKIDHIIPEFPLRIGTIYPNINHKKPNQSYKVDYVAISNFAKKVYFIELKTDMSSITDNQFKYLLEAKKKGIEELLNGVEQIYNATKAKKKYSKLKSHLSNFVLNDFEIEIIYILSKNTTKDAISITFDEIVKTLKHKDDSLTKRFVKSLELWSK